jgi:lipopolysaccharide transport system ATP-binding protein
VPPIIAVAGLAKAYRLHDVRQAYLKQALFKLLRTGRWPAPATYEVLRDVSFEIRAGEAVAVIGANGAGKSTLLKLLARVLRPTAGTIAVAGRIACLIELGGAFVPDLTGRENVYVYGALIGMSRREIDAAFEAAVAFAEMGALIDQPARTYSSGMTARLAFAIALHAEPDVLLGDEVLAVGDAAFRAKCWRALHAMKAAGKTMVWVSHAGEDLRQLCDRAIWLERGVVVADGPIDEVLAAYDDRARLAAAPLG